MLNFWIQESHDTRTQTPTPAVQLGRVQPNEPHFATAGASFAEARELIRSIEEVKRVVELHRGTRSLGATVDFTRRVVSALDAAQV